MTVNHQIFAIKTFWVVMLPYAVLAWFVPEVSETFFRIVWLAFMVEMWENSLLQKQIRGLDAIPLGHKR